MAARGSVNVVIATSGTKQRKNAISKGDQSLVKREKEKKNEVEEKNNGEIASLRRDA